MKIGFFWKLFLARYVPPLKNASLKKKNKKKHDVSKFVLDTFRREYYLCVLSRLQFRHDSVVRVRKKKKKKKFRIHLNVIFLKFV